MKRRVLDPSLQLFPTDVVQKTPLSLNMYIIPIGMTYFIIAIVAAMKLICEGYKFLTGRRHVSSDLKIYYFSSRL